MTEKDKAFEALYEELKQYKEDFVFQAEKSLLLDLLLFYDSLNWMKTSLQSGDISPDGTENSIQFLIDEFLEILYRRDVVPMEATDSFDPTRHKGIKISPTSDPSRDRRILQVLKRGFTRGDRVLRSEEVVLQRHLPGTPPR